jgi:arylsulfatase A-like enzyme
VSGRPIRFGLLAVAVAVLGVVGVLHWGRLRGPRPNTNANLVICLLDAARADHFGCYDYPRDTTPNVDRLAKQGVLFEHHFAAATFTKASTASLFTSLYPDSHLILENADSPGISKGSFTLAKGLAAAGLRTALFSSDPWLSREQGIGADFQDAYDLSTMGRRASELSWSPEPLLRRFDEWLGKHRKQRFFAYLHIMAPHEPYAQPIAFSEQFTGTPPGYRPERYHPAQYSVPIGNDAAIYPSLPGWINAYDANLRYGDWVIGEVEAKLRAAGVLDRTVLVITADHGEAFGEHGYVTHGGPVTDEVSHIPLVMVVPQGARPGRATALTQTTDLLPTLCELLGADYPKKEVQGRSLVPVILGQSDRVHDYVFTRATQAAECPTDFAKYAIRDGTHALVLYENGKWPALYDLKADPGETKDVAAAQPQVARKMADAFRTFAKQQRRPPLAFLGEAAPAPAPAAPPRKGLTPQQERTLRALGYTH